MNAKKWFVCLLALLLVLPLLCVGVSAKENPEFRYELTVDGKDTVEVQTGDIITVTLYLYRTDDDEPYTMYAMQDEIRYDSEYFELVEDSAVLANGIQSTDIGLVDNHREFYMNYVSFSGGARWQAKTRIGSFQLRVIGTSGVTTITNEDCLVSFPDGSGSYRCEANELTVILTTACTVKFETNGGTEIDPVKAVFGETISRPEDPVREGKELVGWYKDIHLTQEWNFKTDKVQGNMTLYAKWKDATETPPPTTEPSKPTEPSTTPTQPQRPTEPVEPPEFGLPREFYYGALILLGVLLLAGIAMLGIRLWPLFLLWLLPLFSKRELVYYSLENGDLSLNYREESGNYTVEVVIHEGDRKYRLGTSGLMIAGQTLQYIANDGSRPVARIAPGTYQGKLIVSGNGWCRINACSIKAVDRKLEDEKQ